MNICTFVAKSRTFVAKSRTFVAKLRTFVAKCRLELFRKFIYFGRVKRPYREAPLKFMPLPFGQWANSDCTPPYILCKKTIHFETGRHPSIHLWEPKIPSIHWIILLCFHVLIWRLTSTWSAEDSGWVLSPYSWSPWYIFIFQTSNS